MYLIIKYSSLAQSVEHSAVNRSVVGSSPTGDLRKPVNSTFTGFIYFRKQRAWRTCSHVHLATAARAKDHRGL